MAVLELVDGLTAEILINGEPAHEYDDPDEVEVKHENHAIRKYQIKHTVSKYIESESGQNFSIRMTVGRPLGHAKMAHPKLTMDVEVDGILVWTLICERPWFKHHPDGAEWSDVLAGPKDGKGHGCTIREFSFLKIDTSADVTQSTLIKRQTERMKKRGTIVIKVYNSNAGKSGGPQVKIPQGKEKGFLERSQATVSEKAVKGTAKSHAATLGESKKTTRGPVFRCEKKDGEDWPVAIFKFIYRDLDALRQMHIIPRDDSPTPPPAPFPIAPAAPVPASAPMLPPMTLEQISEMFAMWQRAQAGQTGIFPTTKNKSEEPQIKKEHGEKRPLSDAEVRSSKKLKVDENGVIDITSDGEDDFEYDDEEDAAIDAPEVNSNRWVRPRNVLEDSDNEAEEGLFVEQDEY